MKTRYTFCETKPNEAKGDRIFSIRVIPEFVAIRDSDIEKIINEAAIV